MCIEKFHAYNLNIYNGLYFLSPLQEIENTFFYHNHCKIVIPKKYSSYLT